MDPIEYFKKLTKKYALIARSPVGCAMKGEVSDSIGSKFNIRDGKVKKQLPKKLIDDEEERIHCIPKFYRGHGKRKTI